MLTTRRQNKTELDRVRTHMTAPLAPGEKRKPFEFSAYKAAAVKAQLEELFHGKCAYCESYYGSQAPVDVEHYRPKGRVEDAIGHQGYWWLAAEWTNLLPSCIDCNRRRKQRTPVLSSDLDVLYREMKTGKQDAFPVGGVRADSEGADLGAEKALLLDPTKDDPQAHLAFWLEEGRKAGLIYPRTSQGGDCALVVAAEAGAAAVAAAGAAAGLSVRGAVSIQVFGLNRMGLLQERARLVERLRFLETLLVDITAVIDRLEAFNRQPRHPEVADALSSLRTLQVRVLDEMRALAEPGAPYSSLASAYLRDLKSRIAS
jgi:uncharacterized protein (TIGR02646 family)